MTEHQRRVLGRVEDFQELPAKVAVDGRSYFLVRDAAGYRLLSTICPHQGGTVVDEGTRFQCPIHNWQFDRSTGRCLNAPSRTLTSYPVVIDNGRLLVELPSDRSATARAGVKIAPTDLVVRLHAHACVEISRNGFTLLTDPWLDGPAFFGAWAPHPAPSARGPELKPDAILITHEHPDHFHEPTLRHFNRATTIYVPDFPNGRLQRRLAALAFTDVRTMRFGDPVAIGREWSLTAFEPDSMWNDALVLIDAAGFRIFDVNDAGINARLARMVGPVDLLAIQFSAGASGYPWTWKHLSDEQKMAISKQMCAGKLELIAQAAATYHATAVLPFASHFALWHPQHLHFAEMMTRNTLEDVQAAMTGSAARVIDLMPGDAWDASQDLILRGPAPGRVDTSRFFDDLPTDESLSRDETVAYLSRLNDAPEIALCEDLTVRITGRSSRPGVEPLDLAFEIAGGRLAMLPALPDRPNLTMAMPLAILTAVVREDLSWDDAFIGYWCEFDRHPDVYHAGFWRLFQAPYFKKQARLGAVAATGRVSAQSVIAEVLEAHGAVADQVLRRYGLYCFGCHHSTAESIELAARQHGVDARRVDHLVKELNHALFGETERTL